MAEPDAAEDEALDDRVARQPGRAASVSALPAGIVNLTWWESPVQQRPAPSAGRG
ncbi:MAG: hypothetical protein ACLFU8_17755 [Anaerolineales bacterium]